MNHDSLAIQIHIDNVTLPDDADFDWSEDHVTRLVTQTMDKTDQELETPIRFKNFIHERLDDEKHWSDVAYVEATEGYFFVTAALTDQFTVVYSRWD